MKIKNKKVTLTATAGKVSLHRMQGGFPHIEADDAYVAFENDRTGARFRIYKGGRRAY
jgi:hypothetical protein